MSHGCAPEEIETLQDHTNTYIRHVLNLYRGNVTKAAEALHIGRATLYRWLNGGDSKQRGANRDAFTIRERQALRAKVLQEVLTEWQSANSNNGKFTRWLTKQLTEVGNR